MKNATNEHFSPARAEAGTRRALTETRFGMHDPRAGWMTAPVQFARRACGRLLRACTNAHQSGRVLLDEPDVGPADGLDRFREQLDAPALPHAVRARGPQVLQRLAGLAPTDPEHAAAREYLHCVLSLPWGVRTRSTPNPDYPQAILEAGHAAHRRVTRRLVDYVAVRQANPTLSFPLLCLVGPPGVGKTTLAQLVSAALGRSCAWVDCGRLADSAALPSARAHAPGTIVEALQRAGSFDPMVLLDDIDRLDAESDTVAALSEMLEPGSSASFHDRYLDLPLDLSEAVFVATASCLDQVPAMLRDTMAVIELSGYTDVEKCIVALAHLLPDQLERHGLTPDQLDVSAASLLAIIHGYTSETGVWQLAASLGAVCGQVLRRRADGDETPVEVTPQTVVEMLGVPDGARAEVTARTRRPGVAVGLSLTEAGNGDLVFVEALRMPGTGKLTLTGGRGVALQESARAALSWLRAHAARYHIDPDFHRNSDIHVHLQSGDGRVDGPSAGLTMVCALASAVTGRRVREDLAMTGEITLCGRVLPVGGITEKVLAAHRCGLNRVVLPQQNHKQVDEDFDNDLRRVVTVHYVTEIDDLLQLALEQTSAGTDTGVAVE